ncbi:hypothetical protein Vadar_012058 [Vaccinium darrowii]|uniref:Uncharacterized protein n=1 Tax=Vaccinium darrowii TaxID=229202 RepID=A0ACB7YLL5_9ERIC|nr:hypothetical protein Vadar_012058 [Vaccinium darrowii]
MGVGLRLGSDVRETKDSLWDVEETDDNLYLRMDMPGLDKEDVKVIVEQKTPTVKGETIVEQNTVIVNCETKEKSGEKDSCRRYTNKIDLPSKLYKTNQIKAEMKNGVLKVVVPKLKEEERSNLLLHVKVEPFGPCPRAGNQSLGSSTPTAVPKSILSVVLPMTFQKLASSNLFPYSLRATRQAIPSTHSAYRFQRTFINPQPRYRKTLERRDRPCQPQCLKPLRIDPITGKRLPPYQKPIQRPRYQRPLIIDRIHPDFFSASRGTGAGLGLGEKKDSLWDAEETDDNLYLRMDMPGLGKEDVKVIVKQTLILQGKTIVEQSTVIVKGETMEKSGKKNSGRRYTNKIDLPSKLYKTNQIKAEMKNGVLKIVVPKVKEEERSDVFHVKAEPIILAFANSIGSMSKTHRPKTFPQYSLFRDPPLPGHGVLSCPERLVSSNLLPKYSLRCATCQAIPWRVSSNLLPKYTLPATRQAIPPTHSAFRLLNTNARSVHDVYIVYDRSDDDDGSDDDDLIITIHGGEDDSSGEDDGSDTVDLKITIHSGEDDSSGEDDGSDDDDGSDTVDLKITIHSGEDDSSGEDDGSDTVDLKITIHSGEDDSSDDDDHREDDNDHSDTVDLMTIARIIATIMIIVTMMI